MLLFALDVCTMNRSLLDETGEEAKSFCCVETDRLFDNLPLSLFCVVKCSNEIFCVLL